MSAGHLTPDQSRWNRKVAAEFKTRHRKWPLDTQVLVMTPAGYLRGRVFKHWRKYEVAAGCTIEFPRVVDMGDANGARFCHEISFRSLRKVPPMKECEECGGSGETMTMVCYGGSPYEKTDTCEDCNGDGEVEA